MVTFQPRWVFDSLKASGRNSRKIVREKISTYDDVAVFPGLGLYGHLDNREWRQYFIPDSNDTQHKECHFVSINKDEIHDGVIWQKGSPVTMEQAVMALLPETGSVEVQRDAPHKEHKTHTHLVNETLLIIVGEITFTVGDNQMTCTSGDRILLTANTPHSSRAGGNGCICNRA